MTCLRYWVGRHARRRVPLRPGLACWAAIADGNVLVEPPVVEMIAEDGVLADTKLIAEPWDAAGLYQVGEFPSAGAGREWNGQYRDDVRRFWRGDPGMARPAGHAPVRQCRPVQATGRLPLPLDQLHHLPRRLHALATWSATTDKHNEANGEGNRDGSDDNCQLELRRRGADRRPADPRAAPRQARNLMATLLLSQGVPMLLAGDEFLRTQQRQQQRLVPGQRDQLGRLDAGRREQADFLRFTREMIALRKRHRPCGGGPSSSARAGGVRPDIAWHGLEPDQPDFSPASRVLAYSLDGSQTGRGPDQDIYVAINGDRNQTIPLRVPKSPSGRPWRRRGGYVAEPAVGHRRRRDRSGRAGRGNLSVAAVVIGGADHDIELIANPSSTFSRSRGPAPRVL